MTPATMGGAFSPTGDAMHGNMASPGYQSPSPYYGQYPSPHMAKSPTYGAPNSDKLVSPIYHHGQGGLQSPNYLPGTG